MSASLNDRPNKVEVAGDAATVIVGGAGTQGEPGVGVPAGGATSDILVKNSGTDYDTEWTAAPTVDSLQFDTAAGIEPDTVGEVAWDTDEGTLAVRMNGGNVTGRVMEHSFYRVQADEAISKGDLCMAVGTVGNSGVILVAKARTSYGALTNIPSQRLMGLAAGDIAQGATGLVVAFGKVRQINTSTFAEGDILYADPTTPGGLTATQPAAPNWRTIIALVITDSATVGELFVRPTFGPNLADDEAVTLTSPVDGDVLTFDGTVWRNEAPAASGIPATIIDAKGDLIVGTAADTAARLAVGTNGHVLTADSAQAGGVKWAAVTADAPGLVGHSAARINTGQSVGSISQTASRLFACAMYLSGTIDLVNINTGGATGATLNVMIYANSGSYPGALLHDTGAINCATGGDKSASVSWTLTAGWYWVAALTLGANQVLTSSTIPTFAYNTKTGSTTGNVFLFAAASSVPNPFPSLSAIAGVNTSMPNISLRFA